MIGISLLHLINVLLGNELPQTQTTPEECAELVRHLPGAKTIVEVGVYEGASTVLLAVNADSDAKIYGIDPMFPGRLGICWGEMVAKHSTKSARSTGRVRFVKLLSHEASDQVAGLVDFMFIDGDHSLDGIRRDWETWAPRIRIGGIMALHDSFLAPNSSQTLGSHKFYEDVISHDKRFQQIARQDSLSVLRRETI